MASTGEAVYVLQAAAPTAASTMGKAINAKNNNYALPVAA
jgi:hypothetical protein